MNFLLTFFEWLGSGDKAVVAERDAQLAYGRNFALVTLFIQTSITFVRSGHYLAGSMLGFWSLFLCFCMGFPPVPSFVPQAKTSAGHLIAGAACTLGALAFQAMMMTYLEAKLN